MNEKKFEDLLKYIESLNGINDKDKLADLVKARFNLSTDRKIFYCDDFAIRFSKAKTHNISNTILSLSKLQKYDDRPVISCVVLPNENYMMLCNSTFLKKISQTSQKLCVDNIRGSFNHSDILKNVAEIENCPDNFLKIFALHTSFEDNLVRIVEATNGIVAHGHKFELNANAEKVLLEAPQREQEFLSSMFYEALNADLAARVDKVKNEIAIAAANKNVNIKGNVVEFLITGEGTAHDELIDALNQNRPLPQIKNSHDFGDYNCKLGKYEIKTDIKLKDLSLQSSPKAYNIDKLLEFLSAENSIYLLYFVGVGKNKKISTFLCPVFSPDLLDTMQINPLWAGRNSRGVAQFNGEAIQKIIDTKPTDIDIKKAQEFLKKLFIM